MTITVLPARWIDAITQGRLTLAQAVAATGAAGLGPEHVDGLLLGLVNGGRWDRDPARTVEAFRRRLKLDAEDAEAIDRIEAFGSRCAP